MPVTRRFRLDRRRLPDALEDLVPEYLDTEAVPPDAWGNEFFYQKDGRTQFTLVSYGADGEEGGEDEEEQDITREDLRKRAGEEEE